jgi:hypothetical protein
MGSRQGFGGTKIQIFKSENKFETIASLIAFFDTAKIVLIAFLATINKRATTSGRRIPKPSLKLIKTLASIHWLRTGIPGCKKIVNRIGTGYSIFGPKRGMSIPNWMCKHFCIFKKKKKSIHQINIYSSSN